MDNNNRPVPVGLLALDLDGTLLPKGQEKLSSHILHSLHTFANDGWVLLFATGRTEKLTNLCLKDLKAPYFAGLLNGVTLKEYPADALLYEKALAKKTYTLIDQELNSTFGPMGAAIYSTEGNQIYWLKHRYTPRLLEHALLRQWKQNESWQDLQSIEDLSLSHIGAIRYFFDDLQIASQISSWLEQQFSVSAPVMRDSFSSDIRLIQVTDQLATKGSCVSFCASMLQVTNNIIAVGDDCNDLSMFNAARYCITFAHSPKCVREKANAIISNEGNELELLEQMTIAMKTILS